MAVLRYKDSSYECARDETVLDCLTCHAVSVPSSCKSGACQTCLMKAVKGAAPPAAQIGLKSTLREQGYFLACVCRPQEDMEVALAGEDVAPRVRASVVGKEMLNGDIIRLTLQTSNPFEYRAGQFARIIRADGLMRSYSLASCGPDTGLVEFHIRKLPGGLMSEWIHDSLKVGDDVTIQGPFGNCFYASSNPDNGILLVGTGSGLAPLWGIIKDALRQKHAGRIRLYHGSWKPEGLYLVDELRQLAEQHANFEYVPCVDDGSHPDYRQGRADSAALADNPSLKQWSVYLCGHPEMVKSMKKRAFLSGASMQDIYADPFVLTPRAEEAATTQ